MTHFTVVSPHPDDAALSLGSTLAWWHRRGARFTFLTCFSRTRWAPRAASNGDVDSVTALRRLEDEAFAARFGEAARHRALGFDDEPLRPAARGAGGAAQRKEDVEQPLLVALREAMARHAPEPGPWVLPAGQFHRDHLLAMVAGIAAAGTHPLVFYEDVPYVLGVSMESVRRHMTGVSRRAGRELHALRFGAFDRDAWLSGVHCYRSQFIEDELADFSARLVARSGERLWADAQALSVMGALFV